MGHMIEEVALERGHEIVARIEPNPDIVLRTATGSPIGQSPSPAKGREVYSPEEGFESEAFRRADVAIEFTTPLTAKDNILRAWAQGVPVISGSTGWNVAFGNRCAMVDTAPLNRQATDASALPKNWKFSGTPNKVVVRNEAGKVMLVWSSNFSVGVNIFFEVNKFLAEKMRNQPQYTPSITEIHHIHKLDKPSGTAKTLAESIRDIGIPRYRDIEIESIREGEVPGTHEVKWDSEEDTIIITHIAKGRRGFALGAVLAAEQLNVK